ncbi:EAL domain-containing protein [Sphingomonas sp. GCM10030256]|uniref:EAL domain-containing protein n=1 Tax=Sphingomonas sp. GCM10030256 TaxID=3273427 RepID=UPI0036164B64
MDSTATDLTLGALLSSAEPTDETSRAVRRAQLAALVRLGPATISIQLLAAAIVCVALRGEVPVWELALWLVCSFMICVTRGMRAWRLRQDEDYARRRPAELRAVTLVIAALAALWLVPPLVWFARVSLDLQLLVCLLCAGLMSAGSVTLATVPQAATMYVAILTVGTTAMALHFGNSAQVLLTWLYGFVLCWGVLANSRQFVSNVRARLELQEQGELIALLREFEASGSDWLWELDAEKRVVHVSRAMAEALGCTPDQLVGRPAASVLDPDGAVARISAGMRSLFDHARRGAAFRDVAVPMFGGRRWWTLSGKTLVDSTGRLIGWRGVGSDITDVRLTGSDAVRAARKDPLTAIANRLLVREQLEESLLQQAGGGPCCALLLVDLDRFKLVNDTLGHAVGDELLCEVASRLEGAAGGATVGRLGGDEFAIVWTGSCDRAELGGLAERIMAELSRAVPVGSSALHVGATIGIATGRDAASEDQLMRCADLALYSAKRAGRGSHAFFEQAMREEAEEHRLLENDVRDALNSNALRLVYQPIVEAGSGRLVAREALLRWDHPVRGEVSPDVFIPVIEDAGLMHQIGGWVLRQACTEAAEWPSEVSLSVNVSASQLNGPGLANTVVNVLAATGLPASRLELEVTENIFIGDDPATLSALDALRRLGIRLVLDDFGRGYCSFGYLRQARFAKLKVDQSFVRAAANGDADCAAIVRAIFALARSLGICTTAEGVESDREAELMRQLGCDQLQGFHLGRPEPAEVFRPPTEEWQHRRSGKGA